jgi:cysteine desulfurase
MQRFYMKKVYLDNAATTKVDPVVIRAMLPYFDKYYGNPSEYHQLGLIAKKALEASRSGLAIFFNCAGEEIIFTSSATEAINLAHKGLIEKKSGQFQKLKAKPHVITSKIEHKAVLETCIHLEKTGQAEVTYLDVDKYGLISLSDIRNSIRKNTVLVSIIYVNNEVGTIEPITQIGRLIKNENRTRKLKIAFHSDATQAIGYLNCDVNKLGVDLLSFTGHKIHAPKGVGALFVRRGIGIDRQMDGGDQERSLRSGTENVPYIVALGEAVSQIQNNKSPAKIDQLQKFLIDNLSKIPGFTLTGHPKQRAPHIVSFIINGIEGESLVLRLSEKGVFISSGSACTSSSLRPSHVLTAMGFRPEESHGAIRLSLGKDTTEPELEYVVSILPKIVNDLRKMSPLN